MVTPLVSKADLVHNDNRGNHAQATSPKGKRAMNRAAGSEQNPIVTITYCVECEYLSLARRLAGHMAAELEVTPILAEGHEGIFAVCLEGNEIFNNLKQGGHVPSDVQITEMVRRELGSGVVRSRGSGIRRDVLNPMGYPPQIQPRRMARRLDTLEGKTIYLVDARFDDSDRFLQQMQHWFEEHLPNTRAVFVSKSGVYTEEDWDLWAEIEEKGDAMIMGVGH